MHTELADRYRTAHVKEASMPIAAQLATALLGVNLMVSDQTHAAVQVAEAEMMNAISRELEARKMEQTISAFKTAEAVAGAMVKAAAATAVATMDKEAFGALLGGLARAGGAIRKGIGGAAQAAGRLVPEPKLPVTGGMGKSLLSTKTKAKLVGGAALAGAGYVGYKGLQAGRDYMMAPAHHQTYGTPVANNVNEFGYAQY